jgi:VWFA-related protein
LTLAAIGAVLSAGALLAAGPAQRQGETPLAVQITSPLGRTGLAGPIRIVARVTAKANVELSLIRFYVDGQPVGDDSDGPPYAVEWTDDNPFLPREIVVDVQDMLGNMARDSVLLRPLEVVDEAHVSSVLLEPSVLDKDGRPVSGLQRSDFLIFEDGVPQAIDAAGPEIVPATYTLLVDSSQSMARRMDFVRHAASQLPDLIEEGDSVLVAPFSRSVGVVTGPTNDHATISDAIAGIQASGGTAILDSLAEIATQLSPLPGRQAIVLITDGYDEHSEGAFDRTLEALKATKATVYVIGVGGVAGISLEGERLLRRLTEETGGRAFFPARETQLADVHALITADVQYRYLLSYTPSNQRSDGTWRSIQVTTTDPTRKVRFRPGYFAPAPPPIIPQVELTVRDTERRFVDVSMDDLIVLEDGVEQKIEAFQEALNPVRLALLLDASGSMRKAVEGVREAARMFVSSLPKQDRLTVMNFADEAEFEHDISGIREWTYEAINRYQANGGTALYDAVFAGLARLQREEGRRAIVLLSDGRDENNPGTAPGSVRTWDEVLASLAESEALIFAIGMGPNVDREKLQFLADQSGGEAYFPESVESLAEEYRRIIENLRRRYVITYTSTNSKHDGAWRKVEIRSTQPGIVIESRGGYFAPADDK